MVLTPNGLWVLDRLGILARIKDRCYKATHRTFKNDRDETTRKSLIASESLYGYCNHRVWRKVLLDEMRKMLSERSTAINYGSKFNGIVSDTNDGVKFRIKEDTQVASLLIGSDGIYSAVRQFIAPGTFPEYTGTVAILSHIKWVSVEWPYEDYERNATIQGKPGALFYIPEDPQAEEIMVGLQVKYPEQSRDDLEKLQADHDKLAEFYRNGYDEWGRTAKSIIDSVTENKETLFIWPFLRMPKIPRWYSDTGRVIIVGDGAHSIPPSSGQGINQALEDVYSLTLLLTSTDHREDAVNGVKAHQTNSPGSKLPDILHRWQDMRQRRIDEIYDWTTNSQNVDRMSEAEREKVRAADKTEGGKSAEGDDMSWLYKPKVEGEMRYVLAF